MDSYQRRVFKLMLFAVLAFVAVLVTDTAFYRNVNYHTQHDTPEKLDYKRMAMVVEGVYAAVTDLSR